MRFRRHREAADTATTRMLLAFAAVVVLLVLGVNGALALAWHLALPMARSYPALFFETNTAVVLLFVLGGCWVESQRLRQGGAHVAQRAGAQPTEVSASSEAGQRARRLANVVAEIAIASRQPLPAAWVLPHDDAINAFAAAWEPEDAVIVVTRGALERLTREELQGLVAHEMGHLASGDTRLHMRLIGLVWGLQMLHGLGHRMSQPDDRGRLRATSLVGLVLRGLGYLGWLAGRLLQAAVSRQREFHADAVAVQYTRQTDGIGGALCKIAGLSVPRRRAYDTSLAHLWLAPALGDARRWARWLATHPPLEDRLQRLYGRAMDPIAAPVLPAVDEPFQRLAPRHAPPAAMPRANPGAPPGAAPPLAPVPKAAPTPLNPGAATDPMREAEALARARYWHGPGERHAVLLGLLTAAQGADADWDGWRSRIRAGAQASLLEDDVKALGLLSRLALMQRLATRALPGDPAWAARLRRDARALAGGGGGGGGGGSSSAGGGPLLRLWLARLLRGAAPPRGRLPLESLASAQRAAGLALARTMGADGPAWWSALETPSEDAHGGHALGALALRRLGPMHRPRLTKAWVGAAAQAGLLGEPRVLLALAVACRLLDTPDPPELARALGPEPDQLRIL